jgi:hypothetical protein|tara:strand:+ start:524 stop:877 length:354 start_codon:yes stop_codon:yes gene_type:complete
MVDVTQAMESTYLTADVVKTLKSKIGVITSEGEFEELTYDGITSTRLTLNVDVDGRRKIWRPNRDSVKNLSSMFGRESKLWFGKKIMLSIVSMKGKDCVIAVPETKMDYPGVNIQKG